MHVKFQPRQDSLRPYEEAAARFSFLSDEYFSMLEEHLATVGMEILELRATRAAADSMVTPIPVKIEADWNERLGGADVMIQLVEEPIG